MADRRSLVTGLLVVLVAISGATASGQAPAAQGPVAPAAGAPGRGGQAGRRGGQAAEAVGGRRLRPPLEPKI